jgi:hypothetical protein
MLKTRNLEAYWRFEGNANDNSGNGRNGTVSGATLTPVNPTIRAGEGALYFNGVNAGISTVGTGLNVGSGDFTFSCVLKTTGAAIQRIVHKYLTTGDQRSYTIRTLANGTFGILASPDGTTTGTSAFNTTGVVNDGSPHHCVITKSGTTYTIYIDNSTDGGGTGIGTIYSGTANVSLAYNGTTEYFLGTLNKLGWWSRALSSGEVSTLFNSGVVLDYSGVVSNSLDTDLVSYWNFDKNALDSEGSNHGTMVNVLPVPHFGRAYSFDGVDDYITVPHSSSLNLSSGGTISLWIYPESFGGGDFGRILIKANTTPGLAGYQLNTYGAVNGLRFRINAEDGVNLDSSSFGPLNKWTHVAVTWDADGNGIYYINGVEDVSGYAGDPSAINNTASLRIGNVYTLDRGFDGFIDEVSVFSRVLTATDIKRVMMGMHPLN